MNNCFILLLLLLCCGNNGNSGDSCPSGRPRSGRNDNDCGCGRETRDNDRGGCGRESRNNDSCMERGMERNMERGFGSFPSPGSTCGCEEKDS